MSLFRQGHSLAGAQPALHGTTIEVKALSAVCAFNSHAIVMLRLPICLACVLALLGVATMSRPLSQARSEFWGFTGPWDPASSASLRTFGSKLDAAVTGWIA